MEWPKYRGRLLMLYVRFEIVVLSIGFCFVDGQFFGGTVELYQKDVPVPCVFARCVTQDGVRYDMLKNFLFYYTFLGKIR